MLTYQDVVTIGLGFLTTAAKDWDDMAGGFGELESLYAAKVEGVATDGTWVGVSAGAAASRFADTRKQFANAQVEARAIASLLRDAHEQFSRLIGHVKDTVEDAKKAEMSVNSKGEAVYDFSKLTPMRHDNEYPKLVSQAKEAETSWTKAIKDAVQAVDDADQGVKLALREAAGVKSWFERAFDQAMGTGAHSFNGSAIGDIEVYEAREAKYYADQILAGEKPDDLEEWQRLMRDNSGDKAFTQTYLDSLGPDNVLKLSNKVDDLAYFDDTQNKKAYLQINGGLSDSLATATSVPDFSDSNGKHLRFGTAAYNEAFRNWSRTEDAQFYNKWREDLREHGDDKYDLKAAGEKADHAFKGHDQQVRGYQSLATLMQQGHGYSSQFVADITDDMISMEKGQPGIWNLYGDFSGRDGEGRFANDPVDGVLKVMSHDPETATGYLDPGTDGGDAARRTNDRLHYLLDRDTDFVKETTWHGNVEVNAGTAEESDAKRGLGAAIEAATTGRVPGSLAQSDGTHTAEQTRIMQDTMSLLDRGANGDSVPENLQSSLAHSLSDYASDTHNILTEDARYDYNMGGDVRVDEDGGHLNVSKDSLTRILRGASDSEQNFALLYEAERAQSAEALGSAPESPGRGTENWDIRARDAGMGIGTFNAIGSDVILDDRDAKKGWADDVAKYAYHAGGTPITLIPGVGDAAQRVLDIATYEWSKDVKAEADQFAKEGASEDMAAKSQGTHDLINQWAVTRGLDYENDAIVINMRDEASQSYITSRTAAFTALGRD